MIKEVDAELKQIEMFLNEWQSENPYNGNLYEHNDRFNKDFVAFFEAASLKHEKVNDWIK